MELTRDFIENGILSKSDYNNNLFYFDDETIVEIHQIIMVEYDYGARIINVINSIKSKDYKQARLYYHDSGLELVANGFSFLRRNVRSLLKGLIATSAMGCTDEINNAKSSWIRYDVQSDTYESQGHHNIVYQEFKKVETLEDLKRFNIYFHDYILNLIYETADIFIKRLRYTIEYFQNDKRFEEACATGLLNIEKIEKELEEARNFNPLPPG
jgi:hypothetical protein